MAVHALSAFGSAFALGNVLLPSCWETYRTLRKCNILHKEPKADNACSAYPSWFMKKPQRN